MKRFILFCAVFLTINVYAHQANLGGFTLADSGDGRYTVELAGSLTGVEAEINRHYGKTAYKDATEFRTLVMEYFQQNTHLVINDIAVKFKSIRVILGHEMKVFATLDRTFEAIYRIKLRNTFFQDIPYNKLLVMFAGRQMPNKKYVLDKNNHHTLDITLVDK